MSSHSKEGGDIKGHTLLLAPPGTEKGVTTSYRGDEN